MKKNIMLIISQLHSNKGRMLIMLLSIILFVVSASAPAATIGIGK